jgi:hypothetical protein
VIALSYTLRYDRGTGDRHSAEVKEQAMTKACWLVLGVILSWGSTQAGELVDLTKVDRIIAKEPKYQYQPRYALLVLGPKAETRVWLVMDGEEVLYVDRNGNGDLTEEGERVIVGAEATKKVNVAPGAYKGMNVFDIGTVGGHRLRLSFWVRNKDYVPTDDFTKTILKARRENDWENASLLRIGMEGSAAQNPIIFASRPADAQVTNLGGLLTIRPKWDDRQRIKSEGETDFDVNIGSICLPPRNWKYALFSPLTTSEVPKDLHPRAVFEFPSKEAGKPPITVEAVLNLRC